MFYVHPGVLFDPDPPPPEIFIQTNGLVVEHHRIFLPKGLVTDDWLQRGGNRPALAGDPGTPDIYPVPYFDQHGGKTLEIFVDIWNVSKRARKFRLQVLIRQADYVDDVLYDESGTIPADDGDRHRGFGVFVPIEMMT